MGMEANRTSVEYSKAIAKGAGISLFGQVFGDASRTVFHIILANLLGSAVYGIYSIGFSFLDILSILSIMGLNMGVLRHIAVYETDKDFARLKGTIYFPLYFVTLSTLLLSFIAWQCSSFTAVVIFKKAEVTLSLRVFSIALPFYSVMILLSFIFRGFQKLQFTVLIRDVAHPLTAVILLVLFYYVGSIGLYSALLVYLSSTVVACLFGLLLLKRRIMRKFPGGIRPCYEGKKLLRFSLPLMFVYFIILLLNRIDVLMLGYFKTSAEVGIYSVVFRISQLMFIFWAAVNSIFGPIFAGLFYQEKMEELHHLFKMASRWVFALTLPFVTFLFFFRDEILRIFGKDFVNGGYALLILLTMYLLLSFSGSLGSVLVMTGHQNMELLFAFLTLIANIALNIILIQRFGILGAALATSISLFLLNALKMIYVYVKINIQPFNRAYLRVLYSIIPVILFLLLLKGNQKSYTLFQTAIFAVISMLIYAGAVYFSGLTPEDKHVLKAFLLKFRPISAKQG